MNRLVIAFCGLVMLCCQIAAQHSGYFTNPVIHADMADPSVIRIDDTHYHEGSAGHPALFEYCSLTYR